MGRTLLDPAILGVLRRGGDQVFVSPREVYDIATRHGFKSSLSSLSSRMYKLIDLGTLEQRSSDKKYRMKIE
jgi:hypothetical protein